MKQILNITRNKIIETPNVQNIVDPEVESQVKGNRIRNTKSEERSENMNTEESKQNQNEFELPTSVPRKLIRNATITIPEINKRTHKSKYENLISLI